MIIQLEMLKGVAPVEYILSNLHYSIQFNITANCRVLTSNSIKHEFAQLVGHVVGNVSTETEPYGMNLCRRAGMFTQGSHQSGQAVSHKLDVVNRKRITQSALHKFRVVHHPYVNFLLIQVCYKKLYF